MRRSIAIASQHQCRCTTDMMPLQESPFLSSYVNARKCVRSAKACVTEGSLDSAELAGKGERGGKPSSSGPNSDQQRACPTLLPSTMSSHVQIVPPVNL